MKRIVSIFMPLLFVSFIFVSCNQQNIEKEIIGKWKIKSAQFMNIDAIVEQLSQLGNLKDTDVKQFKQGLESDMQKEFVNATMEFFKNNKVKMSGSDNSSTWKYNKDYQTITITEKGMQPYTLSIQEIKGNRLKAELQMKQNGLNFDIKLNMQKQ